MIQSSFSGFGFFCSAQTLCVIVACSRNSTRMMILFPLRTTHRKASCLIRHTVLPRVQAKHALTSSLDQTIFSATSRIASSD
jgi:hypothetical protein